MIDSSVFLSLEGTVSFVSDRVKLLLSDIEI